MTTILAGTVSGVFALAGYVSLGYPLLLKVMVRRVPRGARPAPPTRWPHVTIVVPAYNEASGIAATLESLLAVEYPGQIQLLVISDASTDDTDEIVGRFAPRGVQLGRLLHRSGKTAAENFARGLVLGDIVINTDASVRIHPRAVRHLVAALSDPAVGVASGRDVSVAALEAAATGGESTYVDYEMWLRELETRAGGIVGASGCLYAIRSELHAVGLPDHLSRDFAAALVARLHGFRAVSVPEAICYVPRSLSLRAEYRRKVRTMARGLETLWHFRVLLNPRRHGRFAWMLASHKLARWLLPWVVLAATAALARELPIVTALALAIPVVAWCWPKDRPMPRWVALPGYVAWSIVAGLQAWVAALFRSGIPTWQPTQRAVSPAPAAAQHHRHGP